MLPVVKLKCPGQQNRAYDVKTPISGNPEFKPALWDKLNRGFA